MNNEEILSILYQTRSELNELRKEYQKLQGWVHILIDTHQSLSDDVQTIKTDLDKFIKMGKKLTEIEKDFSNGT